MPNSEAQGQACSNYIGVKLIMIIIQDFYGVFLIVFIYIHNRI